MPKRKLARSADPERGIPAQYYDDHIQRVIERAEFLVSAVLNHYSVGRIKAALRQVVRAAAYFHDLGKLFEQPQARLADLIDGRMLNHCDAGVAALLRLYREREDISLLMAAILVEGHHLGLLRFENQTSLSLLRRNLRSTRIVSELRDKKRIVNQYKGFSDEEKYMRVCDYVNNRISRISKEHVEEVGPIKFCLPKLKSDDITALDLRILASCLISADHADAARHNGYPTIEPNSYHELRAKERYRQLIKRVDELPSDGPRGETRKKLSSAARNVDPDYHYYACHATVGSGKTLADMAAALQIAKAYDCRRIIYVAPYNTIIEQTVEEYRRFLVLPGEMEKQVVAAHYCNNDYENNQLLKAYSVTWASPIIVTTAVQFFESLATNRVAQLKKLCHLPGSVIILDEYHCSLPIHLWGLASYWITQLVEKWNCKVIFSSGSPAELWKIDKLLDSKLSCFKLIQPYCIGKKSLKMQYDLEEERIEYNRIEKPVDIEELIQRIFEKPGPRLVVCNTVQNTAVLAQMIKHIMGEKVLHLSTSLVPKDRKKILDEIKLQLKNSSDNNWVLVATSCVEAGLNLSFRNSFIEERSNESGVQVGGRTNREFEYEDSQVTLFRFKKHKWLTKHPGFNCSQIVLNDIWLDVGKVSASLCSRALEMEIAQRNLKDHMKTLMRQEKDFCMQQTRDGFSVISEATTSVLAPYSGVFTQLKNLELDGARWFEIYNQIQEESFSLYHSKEERYVDKISVLEDELEGEWPDEWDRRLNPAFLKIWTGSYDPNFLGYMDEILFNLGVPGMVRT